MKWKPIVVGVDDSPEARLALALAWKIAEPAGADVVAVHAVPDLWLASGLEEMPLVTPEVLEVLVRDSRTHIERLLADVLPRSARPRLDVRTGPAALALGDVARQRRAELVVIGGREHGALARGLGRSTAHYLVRTLDVPLLVARPGTGAVNRVLVAVDVSSASIPAIKAAERLAQLLRAQVRILHVVEPLRLLYLPVAELDQQAFEQRARDAFERLLAPLAPLVREDRVVRTGPVAETIAQEAIAWHADLLVLGSHGKGWIDRLLMGSTTERLLTFLPASVLVVPAGAVPKRATARRAGTVQRRPRSKARRKGKPRA
ncbi:MAG TPA: universal stress protein [Gemmatimonadales bacterium]|nr:universal stress protein [Gemmatimonadales bacterium]